MKWLIGCFLALCLVSSAFAGEDPYIAFVGTDTASNTFYISPKHQQFRLDDTVLFPYALNPAELFRYQTQQVVGVGINQPEVCDLAGVRTMPNPNVPSTWTYTFRGNRNARVTMGNAGIFEWWIRLPKKPSGEINLVFECGVLKPNAFLRDGFLSIETCAAETGEKIAAGDCVREPVYAGVNPVNAAALPRIYAIAIPGPLNLGLWSPFYLTAFRNSGRYEGFFTDVPPGFPMINNDAAQILDGSIATRILLKACLDKTVVVKLPGEGQVNAQVAAFAAPPSGSGICPTGTPSCVSNTEHDLMEGDIVYVRMYIPKQNTVDVYCHAESLRVAGIGESPW